MFHIYFTSTSLFPVIIIACLLPLNLTSLEVTLRYGETRMSCQSHSLLWALPAFPFQAIGHQELRKYYRSYGHSINRLIFVMET
jgi:hypothetical protein